MIYPVTKYPDQLLRLQAKPVTNFDEALEKLVSDMFASMYHASGVGLAAPQIGISEQIAVIDIAGEQSKLVLINPMITAKSGNEIQEEGCLSLPGFKAKVARSMSVTVKAQDVKGGWFEITGEGLLARTFEHEIDHLQGLLYITKLGYVRRDLITRKVQKLIRYGEW